MKKLLGLALLSFSLHAFATDLSDAKPFTLEDADQEAQTQSIDPRMLSFIDTMQSQLNHDVHLIDSACGHNTEGTKEAELQYSQCFIEHEKELQSSLYRAGNLLAFSFINPKVNRNSIKKEYVQSYRQQILVAREKASDAKLPVDIFDESISTFYTKIFVNAYQESTEYVEQNQQEEVKNYFVDLGGKLDKQREAFSAKPDMLK